MLPLGATEQHGPHLPLDTDAVIAELEKAGAAALGNYARNGKEGDHVAK